MNKKYKWLLLALLSGAIFFHQADRAIFGILTIPIQNDLGLSDVQIGWINAVLSWTLALMAMVAGPVGDRFSRKWVITLSLLSWSLMTMMMGFVGDWRIGAVVIPAFFTVMFFRSLATGVGESFYAPSAMSLLAAHHKETRSVAFSLHQAALYIGLMSSGVLTAAVLGFLGGWRQVFVAFGATGFLLGIVFIFALKDKKRETAEDSKETKSFLTGFKVFFTNPSAILAMSGFVAIVFVNNAYLFWAPKFMAAKFLVSVGAAGAQTMLYHHLCALAAIMVGGVVTDRYVKKFPRFRLGFQILALLGGAPFLVMIGVAPTAAGMIAMTAAYGIFRGLFECNTHASVFDVVVPEWRGTAGGIINFVAFLFGGLSGVVMGVLSDKYGVHGFEIGFALMGGAYVLGAGLMAISCFRTFYRNRVREEH